jgi:hypothetical protein
VEEVVEGCYESAMGNLALEIPRYCLVAFVGTTLGSASNGDGSAGEFILKALNESGESDDWDSNGYDSDKYDAPMRQIKAELAQKELEEKQAAAKQVFVTNKGDDSGQRAADPPSQAAQDIEATKEQGNPTLAPNTAMKQLPDLGLSNPPSPRWIARRLHDPGGQNHLWNSRRSNHP